MKTNLSKAFAELRKAGYFAKQNYLCCQSCGWASMTEEEADNAVFYHNQDHRSFKKGDDLSLCWSGNGYQIFYILKKHGLDVVWDGSQFKRIIVKNESVI